MADLSVTGEVVVTSEKAEAAFDRVGDKATQMANEVASAAGKAGQAVDGVGAGAEKSAEKFTRAESRMRDAIKRSTQELQLLGKTASEKLEFNIQAKGLDASKFAPYIEELKKAEAAQRIAAGSLGKMGVSAAQTAAALRGVPAQFTDIITSLQGGQAPLTVFLQQGGQLKDMFGGAGAAARALGGYVVGLINPFTLAAAGAAALAVAYNQGSREADAYRLAMVGTGNAAGTTAGQLKSYAQEISGVVGTQGKAAESLAAFVSTGRVSRDVLKEASQAAIAWERATGQAVSTTAKQFADLGKDPLQAVLKLNEGTNFLTESVYRQIKSLEEQGRTADAAAVAQRSYADALTSRAGEIERNLGSIERGWLNVKNMAKSAWDAMLNVGRAETNEDKLSAINKQIAELEKRRAGGFGETEGGAATGRPSSAAQARVQAELAALGAQKAALEGVIYAERERGRQEAENAANRKLYFEWDQKGASFATKAQQRDAEILRARTKGQQLVNAGLITQAQLEERVGAIRKKYEEKPSSGAAGTGQNEVAAIRAKIAETERYLTALQAQGAEAEKLTEGEKLVIKIQEELKTSISGVARAQKEKALAAAQTLAALDRQVVQEQELSKANAKAEAEYRKGLAAMADKTDAIEKQARELEAANAAFGKSKIAIEEYTTAQKQEQLQKLQGLSLQGEFTQELEREIAARKRLTEAMREAAYKSANAKFDEALTQAREQNDLVREEISLIGLSEVERKKIIAAREVEIELAKELREIDKMGLDDAKSEELRIKARAKARTKAETAQAKATLDEWQKSADDINRALTDSLFRAFESGKDFGETLRDSLKAMFNTLVLRPTISAVMQPVSMLINGAVQGGPSMLGQGQGGGGVLGGGLTDWSTWGSGSGDWLMTQSTKLGLNGMQSMGDAAFALGDTIKSVDTWLKDIPGFSGGIGSAAGYLGSVLALTQGKVGTGVGSAIGTWALPGIGTMIGGALGGLIDDLFGSDSVPRFAATAEYRSGTTSRGWTPDDQWNDAIYPTVSALALGIGSALDATAKTFGKTAGYELFASFSKDAENKGVFGALNITGPDGKSLVDWSQYDTKWGGRHFSDGDAGEKEFMAAITADVKTAFQSMDIPTWSKQLINAAENIDGINAALQQIGTVKAVFDGLGQSMSMFSGISGELQTQLLSMSGSIDALSSNAGAFYEGFYSEQERMDILARNLRESLSGLNLSIDPALGDDAKESFRAAVEGAMDAGQGELAAKLLAMSGSFATAADYAQKHAEESSQAIISAAQEAAQAAQELASSLRSSLIGLEARFAEGGFSRQYQAQDAAGVLQGLFAGVGIQKDSAVLTQQILAATAPEIEAYFRDMWGMLDTDEARSKLVEVTGVLMDLAEASGSAAQSASDLARKLSNDAASALSAMGSAGSLLDRIDAAKGGSGTGYGMLREQRLWAAMAEADYKQQIDLAGQLTDSVLSRYQLEQQNAQKLLDFGKSLRSYVDGLKLGNLSPLTTGEKLAEAAKQYQDTLAKAQAGDEQAMGALQGISSSYLDLARQYFASSEDYTRIFGNVSGSLDALGVSAKSQAEMQLSVASESLGTLNKLQGILEVAYQEAQADYISQSKLLEDQLKAMLGTESGIQAVADAIAGLPAEIAAHFNVLTPASAGVDGSHAGGLAYVPFDGYRAELHKGERVLTAAESRAYQPPIWTNYGTGDGMAAMASEIKAMRAELVQLRAENRQDAQMQVRATVESNRENAADVVRGVEQSTVRAAYGQNLNKGADYK